MKEELSVMERVLGCPYLQDIKVCLNLIFSFSFSFLCVTEDRGNKEVFNQHVYPVFSLSLDK